ncbi:ExbD/TolR family protein [Elusimicrobiota bacterium]
MSMPDDELPKPPPFDASPMAIIGLLLVIIFISSSDSWVKPLMELELPEANTAESESKTNLTVSIGPDGEVAIDDVDMLWETLFDGLILGLDANPDKYVIIRADREALYGDIVEVMRTAKEAGAQSITIATQQKKE